MKKLAGLLVVILLANWAYSQQYIELILDVSGSMYETLPSGETKIDAAKQVLTDFIGGLPSDGLNVGFRIYGANTGALDEGACTDSQLYVPLQSVDKNAMLNVVKTIEPRGLPLLPTR